MGPGILVLGHCYFGHTAVLVLDKVVSYDQHIVGEVLHIVIVVDIALGPLSLADNFHNLVINNHLFEHGIVGMAPVLAMNATLVEVDTSVAAVVDNVDTV